MVGVWWTRRHSNSKLAQNSISPRDIVPRTLKWISSRPSWYECFCHILRLERRPAYLPSTNVNSWARAQVSSRYRRFIAFIALNPEIRLHSSIYWSRSPLIGVKGSLNSCARGPRPISLYLLCTAVQLNYQLVMMTKNEEAIINLEIPSFISDASWKRPAVGLCLVSVSIFIKMTTLEALIFMPRCRYLSEIRRKETTKPRWNGLDEKLIDTLEALVTFKSQLTAAASGSFIVELAMRDDGLLASKGLDHMMLACLVIV